MLPMTAKLLMALKFGAAPKGAPTLVRVMVWRVKVPAFKEGDHEGALTVRLNDVKFAMALLRPLRFA